ncbi:acyltransferase [Prosthecobacter sp.]|uniref:acyltransferase family protein n=1 Tax=Prosthecobacter sp. TaxID=1965333 RepID=UPI001DA2D646|nr:acyltransferase [Prosthecobacter sp.]MCB1276979.1 acyltransferase [Prosthecobacter sp.]
MRYPWIDWVRFLAALAVLCEHVRGMVFVEYSALPGDHKTLAVLGFYYVTRLGHEAYLLFFVLSGFLVGGKLLDRVMAKTHCSLEYAIDRFTRIYTVLLPALIFTGIVTAVLSKDLGATTFLGNLVGLQGVVTEYYGGNLPLWTLSFETWFYVVGGSLAHVLQTRRISPLVAVLLLISMGVFVKLGALMLFCWLIGAASWYARPRNKSFMAVVLGFCLMSVGSVAMQFSRGTVSIDVERYRFWLAIEPCMPLLFAFGVGLVLQQLLLWKTGNRVANRIDNVGSIAAASSYSLYLIHYPILLLLVGLGWRRSAEISVNSMGVFAALLLGNLFFAWLFFLGFESNTKSVRNFVRRRLVTSTAAN